MATDAGLARMVGKIKSEYDTWPLYFLIAYAPRIEIHTLLGFIFGHNAPSLTLFENLGFSRWGTLPKVASLDGVERDLVIVGRRVWATL